MTQIRGNLTSRNKTSKKILEMNFTPRRSQFESSTNSSSTNFKVLEDPNSILDDVLRGSKV